MSRSCLSCEQVMFYVADVLAGDIQIVEFEHKPAEARHPRGTDSLFSFRAKPSNVIKHILMIAYEE